MKRFICHILPVALLILPQACTKQEDEGSESLSEESCFSFILGSKAGGSGAETYRALLHNNTMNSTDTLAYPYLKNSGTYRGPDLDSGRSWLTACYVNPTTGEWVSDGHVGGLRANRSIYKISFVSPAKAPVCYFTKDNRTEFWGYKLTRDDPENLYISSPVKVDLKGNHLDGQYVYDVSDKSILRERRAKIKLVLKCGDKLSSAEVYKLGWSNLYTEAYFNLGRDSLERFKAQAEGDIIYCLNRETPLVLSRNESKVVAEGFYIFALDYTKKTADNKKAYSCIPTLHLTTIGSKVLTLEAMHEFKPQYEYTYTITLNTAFIQVNVTASEWETGVSGTDGDGAISDGDTFITSFTWTYPGNWKDGGTDTGEIG